jgi:hypothetical protein
MKKLTNTQTKEIKDRLPFVQNLIEGEDADYQMIFVSIFDHWLTQDEFETEINTEDRTELNIRREKFQNFIDGIYSLTDIYSWKYKRHNRFFIYPFTSLNQLTKKCKIDNQHGESGRRYDLIIPDFGAIYSEEWDWTNIIWYRDRKEIQPLINLAQQSGLYILEKREN